MVPYYQPWYYYHRTQYDNIRDIFLDFFFHVNSLLITEEYPKSTSIARYLSHRLENNIAKDYSYLISEKMENENLNNGLEPGLNGSPQKTLESKTTRNDSRSTVDNVSHPNSSFDNPALKFSNTLAVESSMDQSWGLTNAYTATASVASVPFDTQSRLLSIPQFDSSVPDRPNPDSQQLLRNDQENDNDKDSDGSEQEAVAIAVAALTTLASSNSSSMADGNPPEDILSLANILTSLSLKDSVDSMDVRDNDESVLLTLNRDGIDNASKAFQSNENEIREGPTTNILVSNDSVIIPDETKDENLALTVSCANLKSSSEAPSTGMFADNDFERKSWARSSRVLARPAHGRG